MDPTRLLGRAAECGRLSEVLDDARRGAGSLALVTGEAGIGKTRLATELVSIARAQGFVVASGRAWDGRGAPAFFIWQAAFESCGRPLEFPQTLADHEAGFAAIERVAQHVRSLAREQPTLIVLDDLQWADAPSLLALKMLARNPPAQLVVLATVRVPEGVSAPIERLLEELKREASVVLALGGLSRDDVAELAHAYRVEDDAVVAAVHAASGGNPLFAREFLVDEAARTALVEKREPELPRGVRAVLAVRLAGLGVERELLAWAALGPQPQISVEEVARAAAWPYGSVAAAFEAARGHGFLVRGADGTFRFGHDLIRLAAIEGITPARRSELHRGWARALDGSADAWKLTVGVLHAFAADPATQSEALRDRAVAVAATAFKRMAFQDAAMLLELAAATDERAGRHAGAARSLARLAEALSLSGSPADGHAAAERAVEMARRANDAVSFAHAAVALGLRRRLGTTDPDLIAILDEALAGLDAIAPEAADVATHCAVEARLASALQPFVDPDRALALARGSIARARATGDEALLARTIHAARPAFRPLDDLDERLDMDSELLFLATRHGDPLLAAQARARLCLVSIERGEARELDIHLDAYQVLASTLQLPYHELRVTSLYGLRGAIRGEAEAMQRSIDRIEQTRPQWTGSSDVSPLLDPVVMLRATAGDPAGYAGITSTPLQPFMRSMFELWTAARVGDLGVHDKLPADVVERVLAPEAANFSFRSILASAAMAVRDVEIAKRLYPLLEPFRGRQVIWTPTLVYDGSIDRLRGGLAAILGDREAAARHFDDAIASEDAFLARPFAERTRRERDALIGEPTGDEPRVSKVIREWGLTKRQLEVTQLVVRGDTNKAIAEQLGCAERTVEVHITAILRKAGVASRTELIARYWGDS